MTAVSAANSPEIEAELLGREPRDVRYAHLVNTLHAILWNFVPLALYLAYFAFAITAVVGVLAALYIIALLCMEYPLKKERDLLRNGVAVLATITRRNQAVYDSNAFWISYRYVNPVTGNESTCTSYLSKQFYDSSSNRETLTVILMPDPQATPTPYLLMTNVEIAGAPRRALIG